MTKISPDTLADRIRVDMGLILVDIRSEDDFEDWYILNST